MAKRKEQELDALDKFLMSARKGHMFVYHVGRTVFDMETNARLPDAERAFKAWENGKVHLIQRRVPDSDGLFEYVMKKR